MCSPISTVSEGLLDINSIRSTLYFPQRFPKSAQQVSRDKVHVCLLRNPAVGDIAVKIDAKKRSLKERVALRNKASYEARKYIAASAFGERRVSCWIDEERTLRAKGGCSGSLQHKIDVVGFSKPAADTPADRR